MKKFFLFNICFFLIALMISCSKEVPKPIQNSEALNFTSNEKAQLTSNNGFALNLLNIFPNTENVFLCPLSISLDLTMLLNGAKDSTYMQIDQMLGYSSLPPLEINQDCQNIMNQLKTYDSEVTLTIGNSIWYRNTFSINDTFLQVNSNYFNAQIYPANFNDPSTVNQINNWCAKATENKIPKIISRINSSELMFLIDAIYFNGSWSNAFNMKGTYESPFTLSSGSAIQVPMMNKEDTLPYYSCDLFTEVSIPYGRGNYSMFILVPNNNNNITDILGQLNPDNWNQWMHLLKSTKLKLYMPRFTFSNNYTLTNYLKALGMKDAFSINANFSGIGSGIMVSDVLHNTYVSVNETGTTAAAVTTIILGTAVYDPIPSLLLNKPFIFFIKENAANSILFEGIVQNPNQTGN